MKKLLAIDPDLTASGIALYDNKLILCKCFDMEDLFKFLHENKDCVILLEAGHLNKNTWHKGGGRGTSKNVGKGQAVGILIDQFLIKHKFDFRLLKPRGYSEMFKNNEFFKLQTGYKERTNSDGRAAAAMVFSNLILTKQ